MQEFVEEFTGRFKSLLECSRVYKIFLMFFRSETPLLYKAVPSWFIRVELIVQQLLENNKKCYWSATSHILSLTHTFHFSSSFPPSPHSLSAFFSFPSLPPLPSPSSFPLSSSFPLFSFLLFLSSLRSLPHPPPPPPLGFLSL